MFAQSSIPDNVTNQQLWIDFFPHYKVNEKLEYYGDLGYRTSLNDRLWSRIYTRPSLRYHLNEKWELHSGLGLFYIFNNFISDRFEITPWQGIQFNWPMWSRLKFSNLLKIEERISFNTQDWSSSFELRLRFKIAGRYDFRHGVSDKFWFIPFYVESFVSINDKIKETIRNKVRAGIGFGHNASNSLRLSFIVNWQSSRTGLSDNFDITDIAYQLKVRILWTRKTIINNIDNRN